MEVTINETSMTANEAWDWVAPLGYANIVEGKAMNYYQTQMFLEFWKCLSSRYGKHGA